MITGPMAETLKRGRERFNTKFAYARHAYPTLDAAVFVDHLRFVVQPIATAAHAASPEKIDDVVDALYDLSLELTGKGLFGEQTRYPAILRGWTDLFPSLAHLLVNDARRFAGAVTNALYNLSVTPNARPTFWIDVMKEIGARCKDVSSFLETGKVVAWRCGMAHYRMGALEACLNLDPQVARAALAIPDTNSVAIETIVDRLKRDPWLSPAMVSEGGGWKKTLKIMNPVGAFRGFGGLFTSPPEVALSDGELIVFDNENCWLMTADLFGATLHRIGNTLPNIDAKAPKFFEIDKSGRVTAEQHRAAFPQLTGCASSASTQTTLAVTIPVSHAVYLIALTEN
jgi:hypothetical protein